ncbi:MAG: hypothetical protein PQJ50_15100 [Spirochaetales bacterium]|nr:hypothetical protein [Spirochaetales bacterium]
MLAAGFFIYLVLTVLVGWYANGKGRSFFGFFLISLFLTPLVGMIIALLADMNIGPESMIRFTVGSDSVLTKEKYQIDSHDNGDWKISPWGNALMLSISTRRALNYLIQQLELDGKINLMNKLVSRGHRVSLH